MGVSSTEQDVAPGPGADEASVASRGSVATLADQLFAGGAADRCVTCSAALASDQRYCVQCGERRGKARFAFPGGASQTAEPSVDPRRRPHEPRRRRISSGATLVAGIGTLLLAMGVGVEIGRSGNTSVGPQRASAPAVQVVTVGGSGAAAAGATPSPVAKAKTKVPTATVSKKVAGQAAVAATKVLGAQAKNLAPPTVKVGQGCNHGAGCQNGKFTGNFFGQ